MYFYLRVWTQAYFPGDFNKIILSISQSFIKNLVDFERLSLQLCKHLICIHLGTSDCKKFTHEEDRRLNSSEGRSMAPSTHYKPSKHISAEKSNKNALILNKNVLQQQKFKQNF